MGNLKHLRKFFHRCPHFGKFTCQNLSNKSHREKYVHLCQKGSDCNDTTKLHRAEFEHPVAEKPKTPEFEKIDPFTKPNKIITKKQTGTKKVCPYGKSCLIHLNFPFEYHSKHFNHQNISTIKKVFCPYGTKCIIINNVFHQTHFNHKKEKVNKDNILNQEKLPKVLKRKKCPNGYACMLKESEVHCVEYFHKDLCPAVENGKNCFQKKDPNHTKIYYHDENEVSTLNCELINNKEHSSFSTHSGGKVDGGGTNVQIININVEDDEQIMDGNKPVCPVVQKGGECQLVLFDEDHKKSYSHKKVKN